MKRTLLILTILGIFISSPHAQTRYLDEVFNDVTVTSDITYGTNITVITGSPAPEDLKMDIYEPVGDALSTRPVIIMVHDGSFLPLGLNGDCTGSKQDSSIIEMSKRFAKRGYVVAAIDFRLGWNPTAVDQDIRTGTYLNAFYRSVQDIRNAVRFLKWSIDNGNPYKIADDKFSVIGEGTGALSAVAVGSLTDSTELLLPKLLSVTTSPYIDISLSGNIEGTNSVPLNFANYPSYSSDVNFIGNLGGSVVDSTWIEAGETPIVSFHCPSDPYRAYGFGPIIVEPTADFLINMSGSFDIHRISNNLGNNDIYINAGLNDPITLFANSINDGRNGLYPFYRPTPEFAPWQWWDTNNPNNSTALLTNPDMSVAKAHAYIDTIINYLAPRMAISNNLISSGINETDRQEHFSIYPNPSNDIIRIQSTFNKFDIRILNLQGQLIFDEKNMKAVDVKSLAPGTYILHISKEEIIEQKKIIVF